MDSLGLNIKTTAPQSRGFFMSLNLYFWFTILYTYIRVLLNKKE